MLLTVYDPSCGIILRGNFITCIVGYRTFRSLFAFKDGRNCSYLNSQNVV
jgi:hypothetical protein